MKPRQMITGMLLAMTVFIAYQWIVNTVYPPRKLPPAATQPAARQFAPTVPTASGTQPAQTAPSSTPVPFGQFAFTAGRSREPVTIGGKDGDALELTLTPRGAGVDSIRLTQRKNGRYAHRADAGGDEPYEVLDQMQGDEGRPLVSFATHQIRIEEYGDRGWPLHDLTWEIAEASEKGVTFTTVLRAADGDQELLRLTKTYELQPGEPVVNMGLTIENASGQPLTLFVEQDGAASVRRESPMYEMRRLMAALNTGSAVEMAKTVQRGDLTKAENHELRIFSSNDGTFAWTALANRFFGVFVRPLLETPAGESLSNDVVAVSGTLGRPGKDLKLGDFIGRIISKPATLAPGESAQQLYEVYVGPKDPDMLEKINPDFVDETKIYYNLAAAADSRCCTFEPLPQIMIGLLHWIQYVVRNYGIAIIILVVIVRTCMHPLTVYQQKSMFRMQDAMARLQPRMQDIKERFANDKTRQNQETMKLYAEEGVNPMGSIVGMLPMFLQMPILVALWTGLNTDINLRHAPFDGWWIQDLAAPDALIPFDPPITIPIIGQLPLLGWMFSGVTGLNLLPVLMGVSMWLQQKYMPKPGMQAKLDAAKKHPPKERKPGQMTPQDQMRQQQMIAYMMTFMFPLMFYYMPAGLNLYWMATNVFGIGESLIIRKQLKEEKERRAKEGPAPPPARKKSGFMGRILKKMAEQAEDIQRKADKLSDQSPGGPRKDDDKGQKRR